MRALVLFAGLCAFLCANSQNVITNASGRASLSLNGKWNYIVDPYENGYYDYRYEPYDQSNVPKGGYFLDRKPVDKTELIEYDFDLSPALMVPGDWNSQDDKLFYYEGTIWYRRIFEYSAKPGNRLFVCFGAVNYEADVYLNGQKLGKHIGGFTPFQFEITDMLRSGKNSLIVKVDNKRKREGVPTLNTDWFNYGGITRDVFLLELPGTFIGDYFIQLRKGSNKVISGQIVLNGSQNKNQAVTVDIPELKIQATFQTNDLGICRFDIPVKKLGLWSPEHPKLYEVTVSTAMEKVSEKIGFRTISVKGTEILLNDKPVFLRGISIHEENPMRGGRAYSIEDARLLLGWAKELGCNYVRLAHYPHNENMARIADEMGIMVWEENPVYWTILWDNTTTYENARSQLTELIHRDKNRASVIIWSMANETPVSEARTRFLKNLTIQARSIDSTRLISAAMEVHRNPDRPFDRIVEDPFAEYTDIVNFNQYVGWYDGLPPDCDRINWIIKYNKPVMISEFGGDALQGLHGDALTRWTEEYQEDLYRRTIAMLIKIPQFRGVSPWILCDFRSPRRHLPIIQDGWNRKGLIGQNGTRKKAFYVLQEFYFQKQNAGF